ncbi:MAG: rod shape-determining protein MreC [Bacilli bacterium]|nr:rod shape-determining protein MreC [Bacilli bacterium]
MKKKNSNILKNLIVILLIIVIIMLSLVLINKRYSLPNSFIKEGILFLDKLVTIPNKNIDNNKIKEENEKLKIYKQENEELKEEIKKMKSNLELKTLLSDKDIVFATVSNRNLDYWNETLNIDKGLKDGIKKNMAVVNNGYLIGTISDVSEHESTVSLLCNKKLANISVKIKIEEKYVYGILNNYKDGLFEVMGIVENIKIPDKAIVSTSGLSNNIPSGITIGNVESIATDNFDLSKVVKVKPGTDFDDISYVAIIKGEL